MCGGSVIGPALISEKTAVAPERRLFCRANVLAADHAIHRCAAQYLARSDRRETVRRAACGPVDRSSRPRAYRQRREPDTVTPCSTVNFDWVTYQSPARVSAVVCAVRL